MLSHCPRCGFQNQPVDDGPAPFCAQCGLPQLRVAEDAMTPPLMMGRAADPEQVREGAQGGMDWAGALRLIGLAALLGVVPPACVPGSLTDGAVGSIALLVTPMLTLGVVGLYYRKRPGRAISSTVGVRLGAVLGLAMGCLIAVITGVAGFVLRYGYHSMVMEQKFEEAMAALPTQLSSAGPVPPEVMGLIHSPEFRAGSFIMGHVFTVLLLMSVASVCGWVAGSMLKSRRTRQVG